MTQTVVQIGNSLGVVLKEVRKKTGLTKGVRVDIEVTPDNKIIVSKAGKNKKTSFITPEFLGWLENFNKEYGPALEELARK